MLLRVQRSLPIDDGVPGTLTVDGMFFCYTLERQSAIIPAGHYGIALTVSERSLQSKLWSPDPNHKLPLLLDVPNRAGIRIHAANEPDQLEGCLAVGMVPSGDHLWQSRIALTALWQELIREPGMGIMITIVDAPVGQTT